MKLLCDTILFINIETASLSKVMLLINEPYNPPFDPNNCSVEISFPDHLQLQKSVSIILHSLLVISQQININLHEAIARKIELNQRKYPVSACQVSESFV